MYARRPIPTNRLAAARLLARPVCQIASLTGQIMMPCDSNFKVCRDLSARAQIGPVKPKRTGQTLTKVVECAKMLRISPKTPTRRLRAGWSLTAKSSLMSG